MKPLLQNLENESLLLLYMAGELPLADRAELEAMLARDGGLRAQLDTLIAAESSCLAALGDLDAGQALQAVEPAIRQVNRSIQQWQVDRLARPVQKPVSGSRMPIWAWSAGSAVAALLVFCIWWGFHNQPIGKELVEKQSSGNGQGADTRPNTPVEAGSDRIANQSALPTDAVTPSPAQGDATESLTAGPNSVQIVTMDSATQRLGDLESAVNEDFATATIGE